MVLGLFRLLFVAALFFFNAQGSLTGREGMRKRAGINRLGSRVQIGG